MSNNDLTDIFNTTKQTFSVSGTLTKTVTLAEDMIININLFTSIRGVSYQSVAIKVNDKTFAEMGTYSSTYPDNNSACCSLIKACKAGDVIKLSGYSSSGASSYYCVSNLTF